MNQSHHTPGLIDGWKVGGLSRAGCRMVLGPVPGKPDEHYLIAEVHPDLPDDDTRDKYAALIAAAPDLLTCVEAALARYELLWHTMGGAKQIEQEHAAFKAAIAKATVGVK